MNRSLTNVLFGGIAAPAGEQQQIEGTVTKTDIESTVDALSNAENVILVLCPVTSAQPMCSFI